jgi:hypothetical protein
MVKESIIIDLWKKENNWTEDIFVLPEKWKLKVSRLEDIEEYLISKYGKVDKWILDTIGFNLILYSDEASLCYPKYISTVDKEDYTKITFEEFQKHVLKKEKTIKTYTVDELIGNDKLLVYLDSKEEWNKLNDLVGDAVTSDYYGQHCYNVIEKTYSSTSTKTYVGSYDSNSIILTINQIKTMEKEIVGYKLIKPEYKKAYLRIAGIAETGCSTPGCDFAKDGIVHHNVKEAGVLDLWFKPVYKTHERLIKMGDSFSLKVTHEGIYHNSENITDYVSSVVYWYKNIPTKFSKYDFIVDGVILSKTGCEVEKTSIKEWIAVWEEYQNLIN